MYLKQSVCLVCIYYKYSVRTLHIVTRNAQLLTGRRILMGLIQLPIAIGAIANVRPAPLGWRPVLKTGKKTCKFLTKERRRERE